MKKKLLIIVLLLGLLIVPAKQVFATDTGGDDEPTTTGAWPKEFTHGDYTFTVNDIVLNVYKMDLTENNNGGSNTEDESMNAYINETPTRTITLDPTQFTINPTYKEAKFFKRDASYIDLGLNLTKEKLQELLSAEIAATSKTRGYIVDVVVKYEVSEYPDKYQYIYPRNLMREQFKSVMSMANATVGTVVRNIPLADMSEEQSQVFAGVMLNIDEESDTVKMTYDTEVSDESSAATFAYNGLLFMEKEDGSEDNDEYALVFHNVDNVDALIADIKEIEGWLDFDFGSIDWENIFSDMEWTIEDKEATQNVAVPNTAKSFPMQLYIFSVIVMLSGLAIIVQQLYKEKMAREEGE